jgi:S1-C subfamily serine protease
VLREVVKMHGGGTVMLVAKSSGPNGPEVTFRGTAFLCHAKGYLLTAAHTIALSDQLAFILPAPTNSFNPTSYSNVSTVDVTIAQYDAQNDVSLLKMSASVPFSVPSGLFGTDLEPVVGATLCCLGYPYAHIGQHALKVSHAVLSAKVLSTSGTRQIQFDAMVETGNSGGPLFDVATRKIIGIVSGRFSPTGNTPAARIGDHPLGTESSISFASAIIHGVALLKSEGLHV